MRSIFLQERIRIVVPALDQALYVTKFALIPIIGALVSYKLIQPFLKVSNPVFVTFALIVLGLFYLLLFQVPAINNQLDGVLAKLKRLILLSCDRVSGNWHSDQTNPSCILVPRELKQPFLQNDSQQSVVESIVKILESPHKAGQFVVVEGESGSGKTRLVYMVANAVLRNPKLYVLADKMFLYDCAVGKENETTLRRYLNTRRHEGGVVIVDNFHLASPGLLGFVSHLLLDMPGRVLERQVIFLAQPLQYWRSSAGGEVRIITESKRAHSFYSVQYLRRSTIEDRVNDKDSQLLIRSIRRNNASDFASVHEVHFCKLFAFAKSENRRKSIKTVLEFCEGRQPDVSQIEKETTLKFLAVVVALALLRGSFTKGEYLRMNWALCRQENTFSRILYAIRMYFVLRRYWRVGFVAKMQLRGIRYVLHERLAEKFKDTLWPNNQFRKSFVDALEVRASWQENKDNSMFHWVSACESRDDLRMKTYFESSMLSGNLSIMLAALDRNYSSDEHYIANFQKAYLLDKVGRFRESRRLFRKIAAHISDTDSSVDRLQLAQIEVNHGDQSIVAAHKIIASSGNMENKIFAEYWLIHLDAHKGTFAFDKLLELADDMVKYFSASTFSKSHFLVHAGSRIYFDAHRHAYLVGDSVDDCIRTLKNHKLGEILKTTLPQYRAFVTLYQQAHFIAHEVTPEQVIFGNSINWENVAQHQRTFKKTKLDELVAISISAYQKARDEFATYGDREAHYLAGEFANLRIQRPSAELDDVHSELIDYEAFIQKTGFPDLLSYPHFYFCRWHFAMREQWLARANLPHAMEEADHHFCQARERITRVIELDKRIGNRFGVWRGEFIAAILASFEAKDVNALRQRLLGLLEVAEAKNYIRFIRLLRFVLGQEKITPLLLRNVILFFPFVHQ